MEGSARRTSTPPSAEAGRPAPRRSAALPPCPVARHPPGTPPESRAFTQPWMPREKPARPASSCNTTPVSGRSTAWGMAPEAVAEPRQTSAAELKAQIEAEREGRPFLVYRDGEGEQQIHAIAEGEDEVSIGRSPSTALNTPWDANVSGLHA